MALRVSHSKMNPTRCTSRLPRRSSHFKVRIRHVRVWLTLYERTLPPNSNESAYAYTVPKHRTDSSNRIDWLFVTVAVNRTDSYRLFCFVPRCKALCLSCAVVCRHHCTERRPVLLTTNRSTTVICCRCWRTPTS